MRNCNYFENPRMRNNGHIGGPIIQNEFYGRPLNNGYGDPRRQSRYPHEQLVPVDLNNDGYVDALVIEEDWWIGVDLNGDGIIDYDNNDSAWIPVNPFLEYLGVNTNGGSFGAHVDIYLTLYNDANCRKNCS